MNGELVEMTNLCREKDAQLDNYKREIERLKEKNKKLNGELNRYKSMIWLCEKVKDCDKE
jgi:cell shape-determining protein MreC